MNISSRQVESMKINLENSINCILTIYFYFTQTDVCVTNPSIPTETESDISCMKLAWYIVHRTLSIKNVGPACITRVVTSVRYADAFKSKMMKTKHVEKINRALVC